MFWNILSTFSLQARLQLFLTNTKLLLSRSTNQNITCNCTYVQYQGSKMARHRAHKNLYYSELWQKASLPDNNPTDKTAPTKLKVYRVWSETSRELKCHSIGIQYWTAHSHFYHSQLYQITILVDWTKTLPKSKNTRRVKFFFNTGVETRLYSLSDLVFWCNV